MYSPRERNVAREVWCLLYDGVASSKIINYKSIHMMQRARHVCVCVCVCVARSFLSHPLHSSRFSLSLLSALRFSLSIDTSYIYLFSFLFSSSHHRVISRIFQLPSPSPPSPCAMSSKMSW